MMTPAPDKAALKLKMQKRKFRGGCPDWEAAIARDEAWLAWFDAITGVQRDQTDQEAA